MSATLRTLLARKLPLADLALPSRSARTSRILTAVNPGRPIAHTAPLPPLVQDRHSIPYCAELMLAELAAAAYEADKG